MGNRKKVLSFLAAVLVTLTLSIGEADAFVGVIKNLPELSIEVIKSLAVTGKTKGSATVARELGELALKIPEGQRARFFENAYAKILVEQGRITHSQADEWVKNLASVPGFRNTLSKMIGVSESKYVGHLYEVSMSNRLANQGFKIVSIGEKYNDTIKVAATDIDLVASKGSKTFAFELKNYNSRDIGFKEVNAFEQDMRTLKVYSSEHKGMIPVFVSKNVPADPTMADVLKAYGKKNDVKVLFGEPEIVVKSLEMLR